MEKIVQEAIARIWKAYEECEGRIYLSFSGGKDSTVVAELIKMAGLPTTIPFVFADTLLELDATLEFVEEYEWDNKVTVYPRKKFSQIIKEYGYPILSKVKSGYLSVYHNSIRKGKDLDEVATVQKLLKKKGNGKDALALKHYHLLHPELDYKVSKVCCDYLKKYPFADYSLHNNMKGTITGIRVAEGGVRSQVYKSCISHRKVNNMIEVFATPIWDWSDETVDEFVKTYDVKLSRAYTVYGFKRTGCAGCPFSQNLEYDLPILKKYEPKKYKMVMALFRRMYVDSMVWVEDEAYEKFYWERNEENVKRRRQMLRKFNGKKITPWG